MIPRLVVLLVAIVAVVVGVDIVRQGSGCTRLAWTTGDIQRDNPVYTCWTNEAWEQDGHGGSYPGPPWGAGLLLGGLAAGIGVGIPIARRLAYLASPRRRQRALERESARRRNDRVVEWVSTARRTSRVLVPAGAPSTDDDAATATATTTTTSAPAPTASSAPAAAPGTIPQLPPSVRGTAIDDLAPVRPSPPPIPDAPTHDERDERDEHDGMVDLTDDTADDGTATDAVDVDVDEIPADGSDATDAARGDAAARPADDVPAELAPLIAKLQALRDDGIIPDDVYEAKRKALLDR